MRSVEWWYLQWPWCIPNPVFKVTAFLKSNISKTVRLMDRVTIEPKSIKWYHFQWPWLIIDRDFKVAIFRRLRIIRLHVQKCQNFALMYHSRKQCPRLYVQWVIPLDLLAKYRYCQSYKALCPLLCMFLQLDSSMSISQSVCGFYVTWELQLTWGM